MLALLTDIAAALVGLVSVCYLLALGLQAVRTLLVHGWRAVTRPWRRARLRWVGPRLAEVDRMRGHDFERLVARLLEADGFRATVTAGSNDFGVDIVAERGGERYAVQVKRHARPVSRRAVSDAVAGRAYYGCGRAMVVTNNGFTAGARKFAAGVGCALVGREELAGLLGR